MTQIVETYITFGVQYKEHPSLGEVHPAGMHGDGYAVIEAESRDKGRQIAFALFDSNFAFDYADRPNQFMYPAGELLRVKMIPKAVRKQAILALMDLEKAAEGGSNDREIEAGRQCADLLESLIGAGGMSCKV